VIGDRHHQVRAVPADRHLGLGGAGMAQHVGQGLADDPVHHIAQLGRDGLRRLQVDR
jgi:hypothetical protein